MHIHTEKQIYICVCVCVSVCIHTLVLVRLLFNGMSTLVDYLRPNLVYNISMCVFLVRHQRKLS